MARLALPLPRVDHLETQTGDMGPSVCYCLVRPLDPGARNLAANVAGNVAHTALGQFRGNSDHTRARRHFDVKRGGETQATPLAAEERRGCSKGGRAPAHSPASGRRHFPVDDAGDVYWLDGGMPERSHPALKARTRFPSGSLL